MRKPIKNLHVGVYPPAPIRSRAFLETARPAPHRRS